MPDENGRSLYGPWSRRDVRWGMPFGTAPLGADALVPLEFLPPLAGGGLPEPQLVTVDRVAASGEFLACDTTDSSFTVTLPPDAAVGDRVTLEDPLDSWKVNHLTVTAGEVTIDGEIDQTCDVAERFTLIRMESGWRTKESTLLFPFAD